MHKVIAAFSFVIATMWTVIAIAEGMRDGGLAVVVASAMLAAAFGFAGYRLLTKPPARFS